MRDAPSVSRQISGPVVSKWMRGLSSALANWSSTRPLALALHLLGEVARVLHAARARREDRARRRRPSWSGRARSTGPPASRSAACGSRIAAAIASAMPVLPRWPRSACRRADLAALLGAPDHADRRPVLHRAGRVVALELARITLPRRSLSAPGMRTRRTRACRRSRLRWGAVVIVTSSSRIVAARAASLGRARAIICLRSPASLGAPAFGGETGRRAGLKIPFREECRFDSDPGTTGCARLFILQTLRMPPMPPSPRPC